MMPLAHAAWAAPTLDSSPKRKDGPGWRQIAFTKARTSGGRPVDTVGAELLHSESKSAFQCIDGFPNERWNLS